MVKTRCAILVLFSCFMSLAHALPEDSRETVEMRAGSADINQTTHQGTFSNHIELDQGSTHIRANKAITEGNEKNQLTKATLIGNAEEQAHYWTLLDPNKPTLHAYADTIEYLPEKHLIKLIGHARVEQSNNSFSAPVILYDTLNQHVISESKEGERTIIIYHPRETNESTIRSSTQKII